MNTRGATRRPDQAHLAREFSVHDREGNRWSFGTYRGHPR
jgi:hypothetical protein